LGTVLHPIAYKLCLLQESGFPSFLLLLEGPFAIGIAWKVSPGLKDIPGLLFSHLPKSFQIGDSAYKIFLFLVLPEGGFVVFQHITYSPSVRDTC